MHNFHPYDKILSPIVTEKSTNLSEQNKIVFKVPNSSNKEIIKKNVEKIFKVNVIKVNIINKHPRKICAKSVEKKYVFNNIFSRLHIGLIDFNYNFLHPN